MDERKKYCSSSSGFWAAYGHNYRQFNEQFKPGSNQNDDKFHKQANGNFEKAKQKQQPAEKPQPKQHKAAPLGKLNKIAKRMTKQSRQEMQQVERMLQETMEIGRASCRERV